MSVALENMEQQEKLTYILSELASGINVTIRMERTNLNLTFISFCKEPFLKFL